MTSEREAKVLMLTAMALLVWAVLAVGCTAGPRAAGGHAPLAPLQTPSAELGGSAAAGGGWITPVSSSVGFNSVAGELDLGLRGLSILNVVPAASPAPPTVVAPGPLENAHRWSYALMPPERDHAWVDPTWPSPAKMPRPESGAAAALPTHEAKFDAAGLLLVALGGMVLLFGGEVVVAWLRQRRRLQVIRLAPPAIAAACRTTPLRLVGEAPAAPAEPTETERRAA
jgi:hypothetical protein